MTIWSGNFSVPAKFGNFQTSFEGIMSQALISKIEIFNSVWECLLNQRTPWYNLIF
jgi:hypothetical protein